MSTRSHIGVRNTDGTVDYIYCHWDGYPENNGKILVNHYQDMDKVNELMKLGDLSSLDMTPEDCVAYGRDRGEKNVSVGTTTFTDFIRHCGEAEYLYLFDGEFWDCYNVYSQTISQMMVNLYDPKSKLYANN